MTANTVVNQRCFHFFKDAPIFNFSVLNFELYSHTFKSILSHTYGTGHTIRALQSLIQGSIVTHNITLTYTFKALVTHFIALVTYLKLQSHIQSQVVTRLCGATAQHSNHLHHVSREIHILTLKQGGVLPQTQTQTASDYSCSS